MSHESPMARNREMSYAATPRVIVSNHGNSDDKLDWNKETDRQSGKQTNGVPQRKTDSPGIRRVAAVGHVLSLICNNLIMAGELDLPGFRGSQSNYHTLIHIALPTFHHYHTVLSHSRRFSGLDYGHKNLLNRRRRRIYHCVYLR